MVSNGHAWLALAHDLPECTRRRVDISRNIGSRFHVVPAEELIHSLWGVDALMNDEIRTLGVFDEPFVGNRITAKDEAKPFPVEPVTD